MSYSWHKFQLFSLSFFCERISSNLYKDQMHDQSIVPNNYSSVFALAFTIYFAAKVWFHLTNKNLLCDIIWRFISWALFWHQHSRQILPLTYRRLIFDFDVINFWTCELSISKLRSEILSILIKEVRNYLNVRAIMFLDFERSHLFRCSVSSWKKSYNLYSR